MVMLSLPRIFDDAPVAHLTPLSWCMVDGTVRVNLGSNRSKMVRLLLSLHGESWAKYNLMELIPLQVEHMAKEFIVEPFRSSGPFL